MAQEADIFWDARHDPAVIVATASPAPPSDPGAFDVFAQTVPATILRCDGVAEELRLGATDCAIRMSIVSGTLLDGPVRLSFEVRGDSSLPARLRALRMLETYLRRGRITSLPAPLTPSPARMAMLLTTMDHVARGCSQREIAVALLGEQVVADRWAGSSDFLRSRVRRLIAWAEELLGGAYLDLLHR